jgi:hypothetical protein
MSVPSPVWRSIAKQDVEIVEEQVEGERSSILAITKDLHTTEFASK